MQVIAKPDQFVMFHADAEIPTPDKDVDKSLTAGRKPAEIDLIERNHLRKSIEEKGQDEVFNDKWRGLQVRCI